jgi:E3 ubiquitin-protein ligase HUWE1
LDGCLLDAHFTRLVYKRILDKPVTYHDMASVDVQFYKSLCWVLLLLFLFWHSLPI